MKFKIAALALIAGVSTASAADMARPYTKAPMMAPVYNWTGFYIGAHAGVAFNSNESIQIPGGFLVSNGNNARFMGGGQIGGDYQFSPSWLVGVEAQFSGIDGRRDYATVPAGVTASTRSDFLGSVTGRLGYVWGATLIYAKGGVAFQDNKRISILAGAVPLAFTSTTESTGYTVGGGLEYMFAPAWSAKVEYQYYNFESIRVVVPAVAPGVVIGARDDLHTVKAGINYHFNWGGPVVAKY